LFIKWSVRIVVVLVVFCGIPLFVSLVSSKYTKQATSLVASNAASISAYSNIDDQITVLGSEDRAAIEQVRSTLMGQWYDVVDRHHIISIDESGSFFEKFRAKQPIFGTWSIIASSSADYFVTKRIGSDIRYTYEIKQVDGENMILFLEQEGSTDYYSRSTSSIPL
jgi:hypothetical protein